MAVTTSNKYGKITVSDEAVAMCAYHAASECYGVAELVSKGFRKSITSFFGKNKHAVGIRVKTLDNKIFIEIWACLKEGVQPDAVTESLRSVVSYSVESFTGMRVIDVKVNVVGTKE
ncbi:MAG: Asp23/Gls24 family envelope stress response protein [Clostridia bacterium]|nr:Asp23/Gls24 family envelope stress response protein [Clostridia bacterium]